MKMRLLAPVAAAFSTIGIAAAGGGVSGKPMWPEHSVVKISSMKSPSQLKISLPDCFTLSVDWKNNVIAAKETIASSSGIRQEAIVQGGLPMLSDGGKFVALMLLEKNQMNIVVDTEIAGGVMEAHTLRLPLATCPASKVTVSSTDADEFDDVRVSISQEMYDLFAGVGDANASRTL